MRVLQVMAGADQGGAEEFFYRLVPALGKLGKDSIEQRVVLRPHEKGLALLKKANIPVVTAPFNRAFDVETPRVLRRVIKEFSPDIVLTWMSRASHACPKGPFVSVARLGGYYDLKYYKKADYLVGNTKDIQDYFVREGWPKDRTAYLPNFVTKPGQGPAAMRRTYDTPEGVPLILALGRLHDDKAFDVLIRALSQIPDAYVWIGGQGPREVALRSLARDQKVLDRVRFLGWRDSVSGLYKACDIYCCPSRVEPLGNVILEAWAHEKPVVAAESAGPKGLITPDGDGLLAPLEDATALAQQLNRLIASPMLQKRLAQNGYKTYKMHFTRAKVVQHYLAFFNQILEAQKRAVPQEEICAE